MKRRGNGEGTVQKVGSHNYKAIAVVGWKDAQHPIRRTKSGFRTSREAREYISVLKGERPTERTLADYWATIEQEVSLLTPSTQRKYALAKERIKPILYQDISTIRIEQLNNIVAPLTYNSAHSVQNLLSKAFQLAMAEKVCSVNLAPLMLLPTDHAEMPRNPFAKGEIDALWSSWYAQPNRILSAILLQIYTGMMTIEVTRLTRNSIQGQTIEGIGAKTDKRKSAPIIVPTLALPLLDYLLDNAEQDNLLGMTEKQYRIAFKKEMARLGLSTDHTPYDCRHTTATLLQNRLEPNALTELMRHSNLTITQHYKHRKTEELIYLLDQALA